MTLVNPQPLTYQVVLEAQTETKKPLIRDMRLDAEEEGDEEGSEKSCITPHPAALL